MIAASEKTIYNRAKSVSSTNSLVGSKTISAVEMAVAPKASAVVLN